VRYDSLPETAKIEIAKGYVTFSQKFKYLGTLILNNLRKDDDINAHLTIASQSMGALKEVWHNSHLDMYSKYLLFCCGDARTGCCNNPSYINLKR
jgi:hypothetical protein